MNIVEKSGAWFSFQGERIGQGRENSRTFLEQHLPMLEKIEALVLAKHGISRNGPAEAAEAASRPPAAGAPSPKGREPAAAQDAKRAPAPKATN
jgi:recombination protein RecA